jgi:hypothetical protein
MNDVNRKLYELLEFLNNGSAANLGDVPGCASCRQVLPLAGRECTR